MGFRTFKNTGGAVNIDMGELNPKQKLFCQARTRYVAYGGARGGGKTHVSRVKAFGGALTYPGIRILVVRREYPELEQTVILPMRQMIPPEIASYNGSMHMFFFVNGSTIKFGHYGAGDDLEYQGQEYDWIFVDEATQFTEAQFRTLGACLRGATRIPRRMYLTCNPGGIGHMWVKRLFIERDYRAGEKPADYTFIPATVEDNPQLLASSPDYVQMLDLLPEDVRRAWRYGDWDALAGTFFPEFRRETHVIPSFRRIPAEWRKYRAIDYGLDMFACLWIAQDFDGRSYVYREVQQPGLIVSAAAKLMLDLTPAWEQIECTIAPPDMWNRQKDSGKSMAELYAENGVGLLRASNNRVQGWMALKEMLKPMGAPARTQRSGSCGERRSKGAVRGLASGGGERSGLCDDDKPGLLVAEDCAGLIRNLPAVQHDTKNPSDVSTEPHELSHIVDSIRYYAVTRTLGAELPEQPVEQEPDAAVDYDEAMTGGDVDESYLAFGG